MSKEIFPTWLNEDFQICNVCGEILTSDADVQTTTARYARYCKLCGMPAGSSRFCCQSCRDKFERFVKRRRRSEKWRKAEKWRKIYKAQTPS
jgi:hypothetical protein